ncbi:hypothetical protein EDC44_11036 [Cricetibacter osteomyelitidis]|uniref:Uncharacterized protein n=1 Tax=Cricetibacter osteomyelitidis TaxID=1521931 RepID=A0A4R2T043_9PAST|nr:hypothetical protein [Cricetibacter osteomyelitidis]TCP95205.1 hypothetical protein EDC44_11036 [Cricetibacter osteomyelitidis]
MIERYKRLRYSIRKRGNDEIEIRHSLLDGYVRGFFRALFIAIFIYGSYISASYGERPFESILENIHRNYDWAFQPDKRARKQYERYKDIAIYQYNKAQAENDNFVKPPVSYEEYKKDIIIGTPLKDLILSLIWVPIVIFLLFLPRPRGIRINRKKLLIYWQSLCGSHSIAYVPETGDPLSGLTYSRFGLYAFGGHKRFSLHTRIKDYRTKQITGGFYGVYPTPSEQHNADILNAIRAYLSEVDPEFLRYIGNRYKVCGTRFKIMFCNAFAPPVPFSRKKADKALDKALELWQKQNPQQQNDWFRHMQKQQKAIHKAHDDECLENRV